MSLDVYLYMRGQECETCGNRDARLRVYSRNITHNLNTMAEAAGFYHAAWRPDEIGLKQARDLIGPLSEGLSRLESDPSHYRQFNPENGWGNYTGLCDFARDYLSACRRWPDAEVEVSR